MLVDIEVINEERCNVLILLQYGIRESGVLFHVITPPSRGKVNVNIWRRPDETVFTLLDLGHGRVTYTHDGSESTEDSLVLELELVTRSGYILPSYLQVRYLYDYFSWCGRASLLIATV